MNIQYDHVIHPDSTIERLSIFAPPLRVGGFFDEQFIEDESWLQDSEHLKDFIKHTNTHWLHVARTNVGLDNGYGDIIWDQHYQCVCVIDSTDSVSYGWRVATSLQELARIWDLYCQHRAHIEAQGHGFVDFLLQDRFRDLIPRRRVKVKVLDNLIDDTNPEDPY